MFAETHEGRGIPPLARTDESRGNKLQYLLDFPVESPVGAGIKRAQFRAGGQA